MKKTFTIILIMLILFTFIVVACSAFNSSQNSNTPMPLTTELIIGTFKLEGTKNAVTAQEAAKLLPLWLVYKDLSASTSAAPQEVEALAQQIKSTMTPEQIQTITDMKLTRRDMFTVMQSLGIATGSSGRANASGTPRASGGGGGFPGGGGGGIPGGGGQNLSPQQIATFQARRAQNGASGGQFTRIPTALFDALIQLLQNKK